MNNKKRVLLVCLFIMAIISVTRAQENDEFTTDTVTFLKLTGAGAAFEQGISQLGTMVPEINKMKYREEANNTTADLYLKMSKLYMEEFTHEEIKELITFYNSDLGKKMAVKQLALTQKAMQLGQNWGMEVQQIAQKYIEE